MKISYFLLIPQSTQRTFVKLLHIHLHKSETWEVYYAISKNDVQIRITITKAIAG